MSELSHVSKLNHIYEQAHALRGETDSRRILQAILAQLELCGATHILVTGLPMPNRSVMSLILEFKWPDAREPGSFLSTVSNQDFLITSCFAASHPFILRAGKEDAAHSELIAAAITRYDTLSVGIIPIEGIEPLQAAIVFSSPTLNISNERLSALTDLCNVAFRELVDLGIVSRDRPGDLSERERSVLRLAAQGNTAIQIADLLRISQRTVHAHLQNAGLKLNASNKTHAVVEALRYAQIKI